MPEEGHYESLERIVAAGFDPKCEEVNVFDKDHKDGGILVLSAVEAGRVKSGMRNLKCDNKEKFRHLLVYHTELGYDLAPGPGDVVSMDPGYEAIFGVITS